jgi:hypothetical protein
MDEPNDIEETATTNHEQNVFMRWKHTWSGRLAWLVLDLAIAYAFGSLAVNSGAIWQYAITVLFLIDAIYNLVQFIRKVFSGHKTAKA